ncbi:CBS domain-containing protein [Vallitalea sp.]|jgi:acetoin utilization protein AcuB|uniref:CBS domain-containing protein n=1 Tax=Vallitalea sp. TaxID=1882829 RepID=UPI0025E0A0C7|nr:CBS domain-containing protein [Vallitalea sp.]MCT4686328.1 CBS domain-containing protein [Vallitalea sp.]
MNIGTIIKKAEELNTISIDDTLGKGLKIIEDNDMLSLPVVEGKKFIGILSRQYVYETYFKEDGGDKKEFLERKVKEFMKTKVPSVDDLKMLVEEAAAMFFANNKLRFIPVVNEDEELLGIITKKAILERFRFIYGMNEPRLVIYIYDFKGKLAKITDIIAKAGGNIRNIVQADTEVLGLQEITLRVKANNIRKVVKSLNSHGFEVREFIE